MSELKMQIWDIVTSAAYNSTAEPEELAASLLSAAKLLGGYFC